METQQESDLDRMVASATRIGLDEPTREGDAVRMARVALASLGITFPDEPEEQAAALERELAEIERRLGDRPVESLIDLPAMQERAARVALSLLAPLHHASELTEERGLARLAAALMTRLTLAQGTAPESGYGYVAYGILLGSGLSRYQEGYDFGALGLELSRHATDPGLRAHGLLGFAWAVSPWRMPLEAGAPLCREAYDAFREAGLASGAARALEQESWIELQTCTDLDAFARRCAANLETMRELGLDAAAEAAQVLLQWADALRGRTRAPGSLSGGRFDQERYIEAQRGSALHTSLYYLARLELSYTFGDYAEARVLVRPAGAAVARVGGGLADALYAFHAALVLAAADRPREADERAEVEAELEALELRLGRWAERSAHNCQAQYLIVSAERARRRDDHANAAGLYEAALDSALRHGRVREHALASELYGRFWLGRGQRRAAAAFLADARAAYAACGAAGKVAQLERRHTELLAPGAHGPFETLQAVERRHILAALERADWRIAGERGAARLLGVKAAALRRRMKRLGIARPH